MGYTGNNRCCYCGDEHMMLRGDETESQLEMIDKLNATWKKLYYKHDAVWQEIDETMFYADDVSEELEKKIELFNGIYPYLCREY